jgi:hypothetical protein
MEVEISKGQGMMLFLYQNVARRRSYGGVPLHRAHVGAAEGTGPTHGTLIINVATSLDYESGIECGSFASRNAVVYPRVVTSVSASFEPFFHSGDTTVLYANHYKGADTLKASYYCLPYPH